jgi:GAF domain-containing protein
MEAVIRNIPRGFNLLTSPHSSITEPTRRRRTQTLAGLSLLLTMIAWPLILLGIAQDLTMSVEGIAGPLLLLVAYVLSRTPRPEIGAYLLVYSQVSILLTAAWINGLENAIPLIRLLVPILVAMLVLSARATLLASLITGAGAILIVITSGFTVQEAGVPLGVTLAGLVLAAVAALFRERDLALIEVQSKDLESYSHQLEAEIDQRTRNILATAEIGRAITETRDLDTLFKQVTSLITDRFDFYHAQVFLINETGRFAVLRASIGMAGAQLLSRGFKLEVGGRSSIGRATETGQSVVVSDTDTDPTHRRNELLPHTRSEIALPLRAGGRIIGALDIQSVEPNAFTQSDLTVFQTMADQLAVAIERVRLFERTQRDLRDIETLNQQLTADAWTRFSSGRTSSQGYRADREGLRQLTEGEEPTPESTDGTVSLPLKVRGTTIGVLDVKPRGGDAPDEDTQQLLEAVAERVAQALDSTRLTEQTRRLADQEQILSQLSAELQASTNLDVILRVVAERTSRALDTSRGFVHLRMEMGEEAAE